MGFFSRKQKNLALNCNYKTLQTAYYQSESNLKKASLTGNEKLLKTAMKQHGDFEYALLYKNTPEYKNLIKRRRSYVKKG